MAFDECTPYPCDYNYAKRSMHMTHRWLDRCINHLEKTPFKYDYNQTFFPIVQGSTYKDLRQQSAEYIANAGACRKCDWRIVSWRTSRRNVCHDRRCM